MRKRILTPLNGRNNYICDIPEESALPMMLAIYTVVHKKRSKSRVSIRDNTNLAATTMSCCNLEVNRFSIHTAECCGLVGATLGANLDFERK